jgi:hypothetical protein
MNRLLRACCVSCVVVAAAFANEPAEEELQPLEPAEPEAEAPIDLDMEGVVDLEGVVVESTIDFRDLQLHESKAMNEFVEKLQLRDAEVRGAELQKLHQSSVTTILDLTRYSPIPLGGSGSGPDTFFMQNYMRRDLNPRETDPLQLNGRR